MTNAANPERDEELEKFINVQMQILEDSGYQYPPNSTRLVCQNVAAFSARRATEGLEQKIKTAEMNARDNAIEECAKFIRNCELRNSFVDENLLAEEMEGKLKSQPQ